MARVGLLLGPLLAIVAGTAAHAGGLAGGAAWTAAITALCAVWWITEPIPIPVTSIIPFAAFPLVGVLDHGAVPETYGHTLILLLLGGFVLSTAMERSGAHRRLAVGMVRLVGGRGGRRAVFGFMLASALLSMWISNTATTLMLLPVATAVLEQDRGGAMARPLLLGTAYGASIGGLGTPVGTPPNVIFMGIYEELTGREVSFLDWMTIGVPCTLLLTPLAWLWLTRHLSTSDPLTLPSVGVMRPSERRVLAVFALTALAWVTRTEPFGGWSAAIGTRGAGDSTVALGAVVSMFLISDGEGGRLLDWETANRIPWGLLILFGGGIALARGFEVSGLSAGLGQVLSGIASWPVIVMLATVCLTVTFMTEVTSNTATATLLMPVLGAAGVAAGIDPALLMLPAALSASCAFMLPVATASNAIVFGTGRVTVRDMAGEGLAINLIGVLVITLVSAALL
jgi:sodium-dependent dicarboxylate transporter 2/3/5